MQNLQKSDKKGLSMAPFLLVKRLKVPSYITQALCAAGWRAQSAEHGP